MSEAETLAEEATKQVEVASNAQVEVAREQTKQAEIGARAVEQSAKAQVEQTETLAEVAAEPEPEAEAIEEHKYVDEARFAECQNQISALQSQVEKLNQSLTQMLSTRAETRPPPSPSEESPPRVESSLAKAPEQRASSAPPQETQSADRDGPPKRAAPAKRKAHRWI